MSEKYPLRDKLARWSHDYQYACLGTLGNFIPPEVDIRSQLP